MNNISIHSKEKTAQLVWTGIILMFFLIQAVIWTVAISITSRDTSHAVVAGYDEQALNWDEVKHERAASAALGWTTDLQVDSAGDIRGNRPITLSVTNRENHPVEKASAQLEAYHRGRASEVQTVILNEVGPGVYAGEVQIRHAGNWTVAGRIALDDQVLLVNQQIHFEE